MLFLRTFPIGPFLVSMAVMLVAFCFNSYNLHQRMSVPGVLYKSDEGYSAKTLRRHPAPCLSQGKFSWSHLPPFSIFVCMSFCPISSHIEKRPVMRIWLFEAGFTGELLLPREKV